MMMPKKVDLPVAPCCGGSPAPGCGPDDSAADCGCGAPPGPRAWIKTLIAAIVILAALGVGAYSLLATPAADTTSAATAGGNPGAAASATGAAPAASEAAPTPCGGGAGAAAPAPVPAENPECGAGPKPCCGH
jgi:hypothetical protein